MKHVAAAVCLVVLVCACGKAGTTLYTKGATSACLVTAGLHPKPVTGTSDFVANSATGGAFQVALVGNRVTVSFGATLADADNIDQAYRRFRSSNVGIDDVLRRQSNAIMLWHVHPQDAQLATVTGCLKA
ncbi:MAG: hypothetical protein ACXVRJ_03090 [Gaiellaceae bacterium]